MEKHLPGIQELLQGLLHELQQQQRVMLQLLLETMVIQRQVE